MIMEIDKCRMLISHWSAVKLFRPNEPLNIFTLCFNLLFLFAHISVNHLVQSQHGQPVITN